MSGFIGIELAFLGASSVSKKTGVPLWEPAIPLEDGDSDVQSFGQVPVYQSLGVSSLPYPKDDKGYAECLVVRHVGGRNAICIGARDTRTANVVGSMKPGDTVVHSTGPQQAAQLQLKEDKKISALVTKDADGHTMAVILDGANGKVQITAFGGVIEMVKGGGLSLVAPDGTGILLEGGKIHFMGTPMLGAGNPPGMYFMLGPSPSPGGPASIPLIPAMGVAPAF